MAPEPPSNPTVVESWEDEELEEVEERNNNNLSEKTNDLHKDNMEASALSGKEAQYSIGSPKVSKMPIPMSPVEPPSPPPNTRATNSPVATSPLRKNRPDTVSGPAARMIASALGVRPAPRTAEQRAYDKAVKDKEIKRRNDENEQIKKKAEEKERMEREMWED